MIKARVISSLLIVCLGTLAYTALGQHRQPFKNLVVKEGMRFEQNLGQVADSDGDPQNDILFMLVDQGMTVFFRENGVSYQWNQTEQMVDLSPEISEATGRSTNEPGKLQKPKQRVKSYRVDMKWIGSNSQVEVLAQQPLTGYNNYYLAHCPQGITNVPSFGKLVYRNLYPNIDVHYFITGGHLKYDIVINSGGTVADVSYSYTGANPELVNGRVRIETPLGFLEEQRPVSWTIDHSPISVAYRKESSTISFDSETEAVKVIDPGIFWGTYYGGVNEDAGLDVASDAGGNVFLTGYTLSNSAIASGGHLNVSTGTQDAFLVKFSIDGVRQWGTYYGGTGSDAAHSVATDGIGSVYIAGETDSQNAIAAGGHLNAYGGGADDAFLVKFNGAGVRQWATYYGDAESDVGTAVSTDQSDNVYLAGYTLSTSGIASGGHQNSPGGGNEAFLVKFNDAGVRLWATYFGGPSLESARSICTDLNSNVFLTGDTRSTSGIASAGHQNSHGGGFTDAFLAKFNSMGVLQWGTYYGGTIEETGESIATDATGNVYLCGHTQSTNGIAASGHQNSHGGSNWDAFLVKFNSAGTRQWGTYYGGGGEDYGRGVDTDALGNVFIAGSTASSSGIAAGGYQNTFGSNSDAFVAKFNGAGVRQWGTYYEDPAHGLAVNNVNRVFIAGVAVSNTGIALDGHQNTIGGNSDAYLAQLANDNTPAVTGFSPVSGPVGTTVTIAGANFSTTPSSNIVFFGATKATVTTAQTHSLTVTVPAGATYQPISVTVGGLVAYSDNPFVVTFGGGTGTLNGAFAPKVDLPAGTNPGSVAIADIDGDGKSDIVVNNHNAATVSAYRNISSVGSLAASSFGPAVPFITGTVPYRVAMGDLDGDGKPDLVVSNNTDGTISVLRNTSVSGTIDAGSFAAKVDYSVGASPQGIRISDLDSDGKAEIIVARSGGSISVFKNVGSVGTITAGSFSPKVDFTVGNIPYNVAVNDFDGDGKPDLAAVNVGSHSVSILRNVATPGTINTSSFATKIDFSTGTSPEGMATGDVDGDGRPDIIVANKNDATVSVLRNTSTPGAINFATKVDFATGPDPFSVAIADLDGDAKPDIVTSNNTSNTVSLLRNTASAGSISAGSFAGKVDLTTGTSPFSITIADLDGDRRPDLAVPNFGGGISLFRNLISSSPVISSFNPTSGSIGTSVTITGSNFSTTPTNNLVKFNGIAAAVTGTPTTTSIVTTVPVGAVTGPITVEVGGEVGTSSSNFSVLAAEPTAQPTNMTFTNQQPTSFTVNFTAAAGNPNGYIAFMREGSSPAFVPIDGTVYTFNEEPNPSGEPGTFTVLNDVFNSFGIESVTPGATLYFDVYSYNGSGSSINYLTSTPPLEGNLTTPQLTSEPTVQASNLVITQAFSSTLQVSWTNGNGTGRLVVAKEGGAVDQAPVDGVTYIASSSFTSGDDLSGGNYVVYNGAENSVTITDLQDGVSYEIFVFEYNGNAGGENYNINTVNNNPKGFSTSSTLDTTPPSVTDQTPSTVAAGVNISVIATITEAESAIAEAKVNYRSVSAGGAYTSADLVAPATGNDYTGTIPSSAVGELGVEYQIEVTNAAGLSNTPLLKNVRVNSSEAGLTIPYSSFGSEVSSYRIVAVPLDLISSTVGQVFDELMPYDDTRWRMFQYEGGSNVELTGSSSFEPGRGYWLIARDNVSLATGPGSTVPATSSQPFSIPLEVGWNQIGNPYNFNLSWSDVQAANAGLPGLRKWINTMVDATRLDKFEGGFVNVSAAGTLVFPVAKNPSVNGRTNEGKNLFKNPIDQPNWELYINLDHGSLMNRIAGIGMNEEASDEFDVYDGLNMPHFFEAYLEINHSKQANGDFLSKDVVKSKENYIWDFSVATSGEERNATLSWDNSYLGDNDRELYLLDTDIHRLVDMKTHNSYVFDKNISARFKVLYGSEQFVKENGTADRLIVHGLWPNPAESEITISFSLPELGRQMLRLKLIDLMGRTVWASEDQYSPGYNETKLQRGDVPDGVYLCTLETETGSSQLKIVFR